jgi:hypothetical protein
MSKSSHTKSGARSFSYLLLVFFIITAFGTGAQNKWIGEIHWKSLMDGLDYAELDAPEKSVVNDSKLSILKLDARKFDFEFLTASERGHQARTAPDWAREFDMNVIINAGMYKYNKAQSNKGYMQNYRHVNNPEKNTYYNALLAMHPKDPKKPPFEILDTYQQDWVKIKNQYHSVCQGMRMINGEGEGMEFTKRPNQACSMVLVATDVEGNLYFIFTRSPYTHRTMIAFLKGLPINIRTTVYLEGGPETSFYVNTGDTVIAKYGSYVSNTCDNDDNDHFRKLPNVIAIRKKK